MASPSSRPSDHCRPYRRGRVPGGISFSSIEYDSASRGSVDSLSSPDLSPRSIPSVGRFTNPSERGGLDDPYAVDMDMLTGANTPLDDSLERWQQPLIDDQQFPILKPEEKPHVEMFSPVDITDSNAEMVDALATGALPYHALWSTIWPRYPFAPPFNHQLQLQAYWPYWPSPIPFTHNPGISDMDLMECNRSISAPIFIPACDSFIHYMQAPARPHLRHCFGCQPCPTNLNVRLGEPSPVLSDMFPLPGQDLALLDVESQQVWDVFLGAVNEEAPPLAQDGELPYPGPTWRTRRRSQTILGDDPMDIEEAC